MITIRQETEKDFDQIYDLVRTAFLTARVSNGKEQDFVIQLRNGTNYIPELALVAEENGNIIGHIMLTKTFITDHDKKYEELLLAPISVMPAYQSRGIGSMLIKESFKIALDRGYKAIFLAGNPAYYQRFGFKPTVEFNIKDLHGIPDENVMVCEIVKDALNGISGTVYLE